MKVAQAWDLLCFKHWYGQVVNEYPELTVARSERENTGASVHLHEYEKKRMIGMDQSTK